MIFSVNLICSSYLKYSMSILEHTLLKIKVLQSDAIGEPFLNSTNTYVILEDFRETSRLCPGALKNPECNIQNFFFSKELLTFTAKMVIDKKVFAELSAEKKHWRTFIFKSVAQHYSVTLISCVLLHHKSLKVSVMLGLSSTDTARTLLLHKTSDLNMGSGISSKDPSVLDSVNSYLFVSFFFSNRLTAKSEMLETYSRIFNCFSCLNGLTSLNGDEKILETKLQLVKKLGKEQ